MKTKPENPARFMKTKLRSLACLLYAAVPLAARAQNLVPAGMQDLATNIHETFTGNLAKVILGIILVGAAIAYAYNKDNEKLKHKLLALLIAIGIIATAQHIVGAVWTASGGD